MTYQRQRASDHAALPDDVADPLLWRLALDVASAHQPDSHGRCRNLQCTRYPGPCPPLLAARRAMRLARRAQRATMPARPLPVPVVARGRAAVPAPGPFTGWLTGTPARPRIQPAVRLRRRIPGTALVAA